MGATRKGNRVQLVCVVSVVTVLTHFLSLIQPSIAANGSGSGTNTEAASSTQPLWSYQVKPTNYVGSPSGQAGQYLAPPSSIFDAFTSLSQRQGALTSSPFMSILPIILIAAGGLLLLLPMLTMMMASPFGGGGGPFGGGGYGGGFGYPQVGALNKRRSLDQHQQQRGLIELIEHVSSTIEDLSRRYAQPQTANANSNHQASSPGGSPTQQILKRAKSLTSSQQSSSSSTNETPQVQSPANHKQSDEISSVLNSVVNPVV